MLPRYTMPCMLFASVAAGQALSILEIASGVPTVAVAASTPVTSVSSFDLTSLLASLQSAIPTSTVITSATPSARPFSSPSSSSPLPGSTAAATLAASSTATMSSNSMAQGKSDEHRKLVIVLSVVIPIIGISLIVVLLVVLTRCRKGRPPFSQRMDRGITPIDDDEIATWRGHTQHMSEASTVSHHRHKSSTELFADVQWSLSSSPQSQKSEHILASSIIAQAPNARSGLTDEAKPGDNAYIPSLKRQSSRLSKLPGHSRSKSRRSSLSNSIREDGRPATARTWVDREDEGYKKHQHGRRTSRSSSFNAMPLDRVRAGERLSSPLQTPAQIYETGAIGTAIS